MRVKDDGILFPVEREDGQGLGCAWGIEDVAGRVANVNKGAACVGWSAADLTKERACARALATGRVVR